MLIVVTAGDRQWEELTTAATTVEWLRVDSAAAFIQHPEAAAYFNLHSDAAEYDYTGLAGPVFINAVTPTLEAVNAAANVLRINGWTGFLRRPVWEVSGNLNDTAELICRELDKKLIVVADEPGLVAARVISMIINEAYFALEAGVSTKEEIDIAMKLGTNYPYGPFEWATAIGPGNIAALLLKLNETDSRYKPADLLLKESFADNHEPYYKY